jgi:hypothetical protein
MLQLFIRTSNKTQGNTHSCSFLAQVPDVAPGVHVALVFSYTFAVGIGQPELTCFQKVIACLLVSGLRRVHASSGPIYAQHQLHCMLATCISRKFRPTPWCARQLELPYRVSLVSRDMERQASAYLLLLKMAEPLQSGRYSVGFSRGNRVPLLCATCVQARNWISDA